MAPKATKKRFAPTDPQGMFAGMSVFLIENGVQTRRLQIWKQKLVQMGATIEDRLSKRVTHVFAMNSNALLRQIGNELLGRFRGRVLLYQWLEDSLRLGETVSEDSYVIALDTGEQGLSNKYLEKKCQKSSDDEASHPKKIRSSPKDPENASGKTLENTTNNTVYEALDTTTGSDESPHFLSPLNASSNTPDTLNKDSGISDLSLPYSPPDLNKNITEIFGKLVNIYKALGDDRRSFSYHKAIGVVEKLAFKIDCVDQVKRLPSIGRSMQDHIQEIVSTGKLSKLEHFETDEKVRTISLFGEVWGIGPATALKLYEKGHRNLDDLKNEDSLTKSQRLGLKYFDDIKTRIQRHEVEEMELLLQKVGEDVLPGGTDCGVDTYFGLCTYPGRELRHRIDLKVYPRDIYAFGLIAWTGNDVLNRRLRLQAESRGFRLDDTGLFPATQGSGGKRGARGSASLSLKTEKEVFDFLGFPCLEPHERNL